MSRAALTPTQTFSFCILFFFPLLRQNITNILWRFTTRKQRPAAVPRCWVGLTAVDPARSRGPWKSIGTHWERNWWCLQDVCPRMSCWCPLGPSHTEGVTARMDLLVCCFSLLLVPKGSICLLVSAKSPGTNSPWNRMSAQKRNFIPSLPQLQGRVCLNCGRVRGHLRREERKKYTKKKQPRAVLSQFSLLETPSFPRVKFTCSF